MSEKVVENYRKKKSINENYLFGRLIFVLREININKINQKDLAKKLNTSSMTISRMEKGKSNIDFLKLLKLLNFSNIEIVDFVKLWLEIKDFFLKDGFCILEDTENDKDILPKLNFTQKYIDLKIFEIANEYFS